MRTSRSPRRPAAAPTTAAKAALCVAACAALAACSSAGAPAAGPAGASTARDARPSAGVTVVAAPPTDPVTVSPPAPPAPVLHLAAGAADPVWVPGGNWNASLVAVDARSVRALAVADRAGSVCWVQRSRRDLVVVQDHGVAEPVNTVARIDARSGRALAEGPTGGRVGGLAVGTDTVWASTGADVVGLDRASLARRTAWTAPEPLSGLATDGTLLWGVGTRTRTLLGLDPTTGDVVHRVRLGADPTEVHGVVVDGRSLWVADRSKNRVLRVDPVAARVVATVRVGPESVRDGDDGNVRGMLLAGRRLWVYHLGADGGWALTPVDTSTGRTGPGLALPSLGMCELATDGTDVWFGSAPGDDMGVFRVDLRSRTVSRVRGLTHDETYALRLS